MPQKNALEVTIDMKKQSKKRSAVPKSIRHLIQLHNCITTGEPSNTFEQLVEQSLKDPRENLESLQWLTAMDLLSYLNSYASQVDRAALKALERRDLTRAEAFLLLKTSSKEQDKIERAVGLDKR